MEKTENAISVMFEQALSIALRLSEKERILLLEKLIQSLKPPPEPTIPPEPKRELRGLWKGDGPPPTAEEIDEWRREMWAGPKPKSDE